MNPDERPPSVSVVIPAYNAAAVIGDALESVFAQTFQDFEVVVVDDGSRDDTAGVVSAFGGRVRLIRQANAGPAAARNAGIAASRARLIAFLDADDEWLPAKLALQWRYFQDYPEAALVHTAVARRGTPSPAPAPPPGTAAPPTSVFCGLFHTDYDINTLTVMVRREAVEEAGGFDERREVHVEDWDLWLRIAARHKVGYLPVVTAVRRPGGGMSGAVEKTFRGQAAVISKLAPLCSQACPHHRPAADACLRRRWYRFHWELGYARRREGRRWDASRAFLRAIALRPLEPGAWRQLAASVAGDVVTGTVRQLRAATAATRREVDHQAVSMLNDTVLRRARKRAAERLHAADTLLHHVRMGERRRILFEAASPMSFVIFRPVYERLRRDPRFEFWFTATGSAWDPWNLYERVGIRDRIVAPRRAAWMKVDAIVNTDFWDTTWLHRRTRRIHMFHGVAGKYGLDAPIEIAPVVRSFDRLLFPNEDRLRRYTEAALAREGGAVLAGYPKVDCLVDGSIDGTEVRRSMGLDPGRPTVIYAPTWSPHSSLNQVGEALVAALAAADYNVIVKLHDRSYDLTSRGSGGVDWRARLAAYEHHPRVRLASSPDAAPYLVAADALVTDHSSIGFEYALLDRPLVIVDCPDLVESAKVTPSKVRALRSAAEVVSGPGEVVEAVSRQLEDGSLHAPERQALARQFFYRPGTATDRAVQAIYDVLALEPHGAALAVQAVQGVAT